LNRLLDKETLKMEVKEPPAGKHGQTRIRLLEAASKVFSEKGFREATIAEICKQANANIAAVNYHFRDKETLYVEAWRLAFQQSLEAHPFDGGVPATAPARERLRGHIRCLVQRTRDPENHELEIVHKELANPTGLLGEVMNEAIVPLQQAFYRIVRQLLGDKVSDQHVRLCQISILSLCIHPMMVERHRRHLPAQVREFLPPLEISIEDMVDHVTHFCLAGIEEQRRRIESGEADERK
jgi:AcrR family transcriptional regulator